MFDVGEYVERALPALDRKLEDRPFWPAIRTDLLSPGTDEKRKKRLLILCGSFVGEAFLGPQMILFDMTGKCNTTCIFCRDHSPRVEGAKRGAGWRWTRSSCSA
ncbi:MAG: hypothetical protein M5R36_10635 [Deltaproteobacteria bacterium]|nr:hypothetical protein [Deltaproteobacteria bacterium]